MTLLEISSRIQDLYYQDYAPGDKFIDIDDFKFHVAAKYSEMINAIYKQVRSENKQMEGFSNIEIPAAWLISEMLKIEYDEKRERHFSKTKFPVFSFDFDGSANALQGIHSIGPPHKVYRKIMLNERRFKKILPTTGKILFYLNAPQEIIYWEGAKEGDEVESQYVPAIIGLDNDCRLSDNIASEITKEVLNLMISARSGTIIQKVDDQNRNLTPVNQTDPNLVKP